MSFGTKKRKRMEERAPIRKWYMAIDIEGRGDSLFNPITAIGVFFAPADGKDLDFLSVKKRWSLLPLPGQTDEARCVDEFWSKFPQVEKTLAAEVRPAHQVMAEFRQWCAEVVAMVGGPKRIVLVTDCPDYDLGRLDQLGHAAGTWDTPIRHLGVGIRHSCCDPSERLEQLGPAFEEDFKEWLKKAHPMVKHSHYPDDDAEYCYYMQLYCDERINK
jgi:hypothetical protein